MDLVMTWLCVAVAVLFIAVGYLFRAVRWTMRENARVMRRFVEWTERAP